MDLEFPKRLFRHGNEPQVEKLNNSCRMSLMTMLKNAMPGEYDEVKRDPVFTQVLAIHDNCLGFSGRLIHSFMFKQILTAKLYEHWFIFARRPLRFSLQEFYAITGLKCKYDEDDNYDLEDWDDDNGFWSRLIKRKEKISIKTIKDNHLKCVNKWKRVDMLRLVYLCVIAGLLLAKDEKVHISHTYIKLVMDIGKLHKYPWGLHSFDLLIESITKSREKLNRKKSYVLDGFSYALQIWLMEAIPNIGILMGRKLSGDLVGGARCSNWSGAAKVSYEQLIQLETTFGSKDTLYPHISMTGNMDVYDDIDFVRADEMTDERVDGIKGLIRAGKDWADHIWDVDESWMPLKPPEEQEEVHVGTECGDDVDDVGTPIAEDTSVFGLIRCKKRLPDHGAEARKQKLLCQRSAAKTVSVDENMKLFLQGLFQTSFTSLEERLEKKIEERFQKLETHFTELKNAVSNALFSINHSEPGNTQNPPPAFPSTANKLQKQGKVSKAKNSKA